MLSTFERNPLGVWAADIDDIHDIHLSALCCWSLGIAQKFRLVDGLLIYFSSSRYLIWGVHDLVLHNQKEDEANITMTSQ